MAASQKTDSVETTVAGPGPDTPARLAESSRIISSATKWSAATGLIPVPVLDLVALAAVQAKMVSDISAVYDQSFSDEAVRGVISVLLGTLLPGTVARYATVSIARGVPAVGLVVGIVSFGALGAAATYAVGKVFVRHYERGGTFQNFDPKSVEADLKRDFAAATARP